MGGSPSPPQPSLSDQVSWVNSDYTRVDGGDWFQDENRHFTYEGEGYYLNPGQDVNDRSNWQVDTGEHRSSAEHDYAQSRQAELEAQAHYQDSILSAMNERYRLISEQMSREAARLAAEQAELEKTRKEAEEKRKRRLALAAKGRGTLLTGGTGVEEETPGLRKTLGAVD